MRRRFYTLDVFTHTALAGNPLAVVLDGEGLSDHAMQAIAADFERPDDGTRRFVIEQGYAMGRPSQITLEMDVKGGVLIAARIGGSAVVISEGILWV